METNAPKQEVNPRNNVLLFRKSQFTIMKKLVLVLVVALCCAITYGQSNRVTSAPRVMEVNAFLAALRISDNANRSSSTSASYLESLLKNVQPAVYIQTSDTKSYGENPNSLFLDANMLPDLNRTDYARGNIEIITISIKTNADLRSVINLNVFANFPRLKYIYLLSTLDTTKTVLSNLIQNNNSNYGIFYKIEKGA